MPGVVLIVSIPDICLNPYFLYSHAFRLTRNTVYCAIVSDQIVVGCPLGVPISYYLVYAYSKGSGKTAHKVDIRKECFGIVDGEIL